MARRLRELRAAAGMTQQEVADEIGVSRRAIWTWERGEAPRNPSTALPALARLYGTTPRFILYGEASVDLEALAAEVQVMGQRLAELATLVAEGFGERRKLDEEIVRLLGRLLDNEDV